MNRSSLIILGLVLSIVGQACSRNEPIREERRVDLARPLRSPEAMPHLTQDKSSFVRCGEEKREAWTISGRAESRFSIPLPAGVRSVDLSVCTDLSDTATTLTFNVPTEGARGVSGWDSPRKMAVPVNAWHTEHIAVGTGPERGGPRTLQLSAVPHTKQSVKAAERIYVSAHGRRQAPKGRPNILLISIDTLRADRLSTYGYHVQTSLNLEGLVREGVLFRRAIAQSTSTPPSHAAMLTGLYPSRTGLFITKEVGSTYEGSDFKLKNNVWTLAEILRADGYHTAATTGGGFLSTRFGFGKGFDLFVEDQSTRPSELMRGADRVIRWLDGYVDAPWFIFLHTYAVHKTGNGYEHRSFVSLANLDKTYARQAGDFEAKMYNAQYDSGVLFADVLLGRIFDYLYFAHRLDDTIIVVTSDHGETLEERRAQAGYAYNHGYAFYEELVHVPLIIHAPRLLPGNVRVERPVELVDIVPTLLELAGVRRPNEVMDGQSLVGLIKGRAGYEKNVVFMDSSPGGPFRAAVRNDRYKYVRVLDWRPSFGSEYGMKTPPDEELYDLKHDPGERENLADRRGLASVKATLERELDKRLAGAGTLEIIHASE